MDVKQKLLLDKKTFLMIKRSIDGEYIITVNIYANNNNTEIHKAKADRHKGKK